MELSKTTNTTVADLERVVLPVIAEKLQAARSDNSNAIEIALRTLCADVLEKAINTRGRRYVVETERGLVEVTVQLARV